MKQHEKEIIEVETLRQWLANGTPVQILDIRPKAEREEWKIPESEFVDVYHSLKAGQKNVFSEVKLSKNTPVVTVCSAGKTSMIAMKQLREMGIEALSLKGGMREWTTAWNMAQSIDSKETTIIQIRRTGKGCLSYILESQGEAIIIDASLDIHIYNEILKKNGWHLKYALDTHIHADHFSRSKQLAETFNAVLIMPHHDKLEYHFTPITEDTTLQFGKAILKAIHTPGHTYESYSYLVNDTSLFSGDTLFTSGVGRPDLKATKGIAQQKARLLYQSLQKLFTYSPSVITYPGHTSTPIAFDEQLICSSLKNIKKQVKVLQLNEEDFINNLLQKIPETPPNYQEIVKLNLKGDATNQDLIALENGANRCAIS